jgi:hypothetical protein
MSEMRAELIAPCGMNCRLCMAYQRDKRQCKGCNSGDAAMPNSCANCVIRNCPTIQNNTSGFCYECDKIPCRRLKQLDLRYRTKYHMSMLENLTAIKLHGMDVFLRQEETRWTCAECGGIVCVHRNACPACGSAYAEE